MAVQKREQDLQVDNRNKGKQLSLLQVDVEKLVLENGDLRITVDQLKSTEKSLTSRVLTLE